MLLEGVDAALFIYLFVRSFIWLLWEDEIAFGKQCFWRGETSTLEKTIRCRPEVADVS